MGVGLSLMWSVCGCGLLWVFGGSGVMGEVGMAACVGVSLVQCLPGWQ